MGVVDKFANEECEISGGKVSNIELFKNWNWSEICTS